MRAEPVGSEQSMTDIPINKRQFQERLDALVAAAKKEQGNPGSYKSDGCVRCVDCMFTTDSTDCYQCTYCTACDNCTSCTHCQGCTDCHDSNYCVDSTHCSRSSYVLMSRHCNECVFCFGCVGLVKKEFHILNQPFRRDEYFKTVKDLKHLFSM